jgi:hypothetical protein
MLISTSYAVLTCNTISIPPSEGCLLLACHALSTADVAWAASSMDAAGGHPRQRSRHRPGVRAGVARALGSRPQVSLLCSRGLTPPALRCRWHAPEQQPIKWVGKGGINAYILPRQHHCEPWLGAAEAPSKAAPQAACRQCSYGVAAAGAALLPQPQLAGFREEQAAHGVTS